jgi:branched-chain amino acid transport system substrate-binding protein
MKSKKVTRREFLRSAALTGAGLVAAACTPAATPAAPQIVKETVVVAGTPQIIEKVITPTPLPAPTKPPAATVPPAPATIKIGSVTDQTGPLANFGAEFKWGFEQAMKDFNADGGINVKEYNKKIPIEILYGDHGASEEKAVTEMEYMVTQKVTALTGSTAIMPLGQVVAERSGIPLVMGNASSTEPFQQGFKYIFSLSWMNNRMAEWPYLLSEYFPEPKPTVIGFMEEQDLMGIDYSIYLQREALKHSAYKLVIQKYQRFAGDFATQILAFKKAGVDFVYAPMIGPDGMKFWQQMKELNFVPKAILQLIAPADRRSWLSLGKDANYVITTDSYHWATKYKGAADLDKAYAADHKGEHATELAGNGYAGIQVIVDAIGRAGTLDHAKLRDAIAATDMQTVMGPVKFKADGTTDIPFFAVQYIGGVEKIIWPAEMKEVDPVYPFPAWTDPKR